MPLAYLATRSSCSAWGVLGTRYRRRPPASQSPTSSCRDGPSRQLLAQISDKWVALKEAHSCDTVADLGGDAQGDIEMIERRRELVARQVRSAEPGPAGELARR